MTVEEAEAFLRRVTYKPGCSFSLRRCWLNGVTGAQMEAKDLPNANGGDPITLYFSVAFDDWNLKHFTEYDMTQKVKTVVAFFERHEGEEWLRLDGKHVTDPHPELKK